MDRSDGISQFCLSVYSELTGQNKSMIAMIIIWRIWCSRNQLIWVEKNTTMNRVVYRAQEFLHEWRKARLCESPRETSATMHHQMGWKAPPNGLFKCNIDAVFFNDYGIFGIGMPLRYDSGQVVIATTTNYKSLPHLNEGEAIALRDVIAWLCDLEIKDAIIDMDCQHMTNNVCSNHLDNSKCGHIISRCRLLLEELPDFRVCFGRKLAIW